jgi:hypothetical protein
MATKKTQSITSLKSTLSHDLKTLGHVKTYDGIYEAVVVHSKDIQKNGRLTVRLIGTNIKITDLPDSYVKSEAHLNLTVRWSSPFAGATNIANTIKSGTATLPGSSATTDPDKTFDGTQRSYGMWMIPPDVGNKVLVMFIGGDLAKGVVVGCLYQHLMNHMVPGIARARTFTSVDSELKETPVAEYNKASDTASDVDYTKSRSSDGITPPDNIKRAVHTPHYNGLKEQGLDEDTTRGLSSSSARRESPSKVFGVLTPDSNQFVMDDGDQQLIRLRTKSGAQILLDETNGNVYIINKKGSGYVEIDNNGKIDVWANDSISVRSHKDINIRADRDINFESGRDINIRTTQTTATGQPSDTTGILPGVNGAFNLDIAGALNIKTVDETTITSGKEFHLQSTSTLLTATEGDTSILTSKGNHVESTPAGAIHMNGPSAASATSYGGLTAKVDADGNLFFTNTLYTRNSKDKRNTERVGTILTRFPTREPFARQEYTN